MYTILVTHAFPGDGLDGIKSRHRVIVPAVENTAFTHEEMGRFLPEVDALLCGGAVTAGMMDLAPKLKIISNYGAGYDRVDVSAASARGIPVTNIPDDTAEATAELALTLMLDVARRVTELDRMIRHRAEAEIFGMGRHMGRTLGGSTLGILGMGRIGQTLKRMATALNMRVIYHNRSELSTESAAGAEWVPIDELFTRADVISINCPLTPDTQGIVSADRIAMMKPNAIIINTSRGGVIDNYALIDALKFGRIRGAGLDVFPNEPLIPDALKIMENVVLTPHIGTNCQPTRADMARAAAFRIEEALNGRRPPNVVNPEIYA